MILQRVWGWLAAAGLLLQRVWGWLAAAGLLLLSVLGIYAKGRKDASANVAKERLQEGLVRQRAQLDQIGEAHQVRQDVEQEIRTTPEDERRQKLIKKWGPR